VREDESRSRSRGVDPVSASGRDAVRMRGKVREKGKREREMQRWCAEEGGREREKGSKERRKVGVGEKDRKNEVFNHTL